MKQYDNIRDKLIDVYCDKDDTREQFQSPINFENNVVFTDCHILISIPKDLITEQVNERKPGINLADVLKGAVKLTEPKLFTYEAFKNSLLNIKCEPDYYYTYKQCRYDGCKVCDYEGWHRIKGKKNGLLNYLTDQDGRTQYVKLCEAFFDPNYIYKVVYLMDLLGLQLNIIQLTHNSKENASILKIGEVTAIIMPMRVPYETTSQEATSEIL